MKLLRFLIPGPTRLLRLLLLSALAVYLFGCKQEPAPDPDPPEIGYMCVEPIDQDEKQMLNCHFTDYTPNYDLFDDRVEYSYEYEDQEPQLPSCGEGNLLVLDTPGEYRLEVECYSPEAYEISGYVDVRVRSDFPRRSEDDETQEEQGNVPGNLVSRKLEGSFCNTEAPYRAYPGNELIEFRHLGQSTAYRCENMFDNGQFWFTEVDATKIKVVCAAGDSECNPLDGHKYLKVSEASGVGTPGFDKHLKWYGQVDMVPQGETVELLVPLRFHDGTHPNQLSSFQELWVSAVVEGPVSGD